MVMLLARADRETDDGDDTPGPAWDTAALLASAVAAFALSAAAVAALAAALLAAQQAAYTSAYDATVAAADGDVGSDSSDDDDDGAPDPALLAGWRATAEQTAQGMAATYTRELRAAAGAFLAAWLLAHGNGASAGMAALALATFLRGWADKRAQGKGAQAGATATNAAATAGAAAAVAAILAGDVASADDPDTMLDPDVLASAGWGVVVLPEAGMCDLCATYAGNVYRLDDAPEVFDLFPAHVSCFHSAYLVPPDEVD